jgi:hypothetical protein
MSNVRSAEWVGVVAGQGLFLVNLLNLSRGPVITTVSARLRR